VQGFLGCSFVGSSEKVGAALADFAESTQANELIVASAIFDPRARMRSAELLADSSVRHIIPAP
jgi:alkanesulfonate monooxygenase SsuD/methylene tetrahydromethanopterin reductase-like flavin-dependent oxidoreductase (luciferase family)